MDPDFTQSLEDGQLVLRYKGVPCLRGDIDPGVWFAVPGGVPGGEADDAVPDAVAEGDE